VNFRSDRPWRGVVAINLNSQNPHSQLLGSALYRRAGLPCQQAWPAQVRINNEFLAQPGRPSYGFTVCNEVLDSKFAERQFPKDSSGNLYRAIRLSGDGPDLHYEGSEPDPYRANYFKRTNKGLDDWSDLIELTRVMDEEPDETYVESIRRVMDVDEWMLYFALETIVDNRETNLANANGGDGRADDYFLYRGMVDPRFRVLPYDLDTILNQGDRHGHVDHGLFRMAANPVLDRFIKHPAFVPIYYAALRRLLNTVFTPQTFRPLVEQFLGGLVDRSVREDIIQFAEARAAFIRSQIPERLAVEHDLTLRDGVAVTDRRSVTLRGAADPARTAEVRVQGEPAAWSAWEGRWEASAVPVSPGFNRIRIAAYDADGEEIDHATLDVWVDLGTFASHSGTLGGNEVWGPDAGAHRVSGTLRVPAGTTLTLAPGTAVELASGAGIQVEPGGALRAEGTDQAPILFTGVPGSESWDSLTIQGEAVIRNAFLVGNGATAIHCQGGSVTLDGLDFGTRTHQYVALDDSSFVVSRCRFPTAEGEFELVHGTGGIKPGGVGVFYNCFFGKAFGYNDVVDFTGGRRPQPIVQFIRNVFVGSGDDELDLDGTDAWVEGNIFLHCHKNGSPDSSSAVSGGEHGGEPSYVTMLGNLIYDCDHAAMAKEGNFYTLLYNTIVRITREGGTDSEAAVVNLADEGTALGRGFYLEGNLIADAEGLTRNDPTPSRVRFVNNLLPVPWNGPGTNNLVGELTFVSMPSLQETDFADFDSAQVLWKRLAPAARRAPWGFGARGTGFGPTVLERPASVEASDKARFRIGPLVIEGVPWASGFPEWRWRLDGGDWSEPISAETPLELTDLSAGPHTLEISARNDAGLLQDDPAFGGLAAPTAVSWTVDPAAGGARLSELLADNRSFEHEGAFPDFVELSNASSEPVDLGGMGLTRDPAEPYAFVFPEGTVLPPGGFLVVWADETTNVSGLHLGFGLNRQGGRLFLFDRAEAGGGLADSVEFGNQLPDRSAARDAAGNWTLATPTPGAPNLPLPVGDPRGVRVNEWLAASRPPFEGDFVELYNPSELPVDVGGFFLTDKPIGWPDRFRLPALTFIEPRGRLAALADGTEGPLRAPFRLASESGMLGLFDPDLQPADWIVYGPQQDNAAEGRSPDGGPAIRPLGPPSPGSPNPGGLGEVQITVETLPLISMTNVWKYYQQGDPGEGWKLPEFDDAAWPEGRALLYHESSALPGPKNTPLELGRIAYYFRTQFVAPEDIEGYALRLRTIVDDGLVAYLNGQELFRQNMPSGAVNYDTLADHTVGNAALTGPFDLPADSLRPGTNTLAVEAHQGSSRSSDIVFGLSAELVRFHTNSFSVQLPVVLNEILAASEGPGGDWIELANAGDQPISLAGCALTDDPSRPRRWLFPTNATLAPGGFLTVACDGNAPASGTNTGFGLKAEGGSVYLFDAPERGGGLVDAAIYGLQPQGFSLGRVPDIQGGWRLCSPSPGATNLLEVLGDPTQLRINEWLADPDSGPDWFELYNPLPQPAELSGLYVSDDLNNRFHHAFPPLSFIGAGDSAFLVLIADNDPAQGADHVDFKLSKEGDAIGLFTPEGYRIDAVLFGPQQEGFSEGRLPDGSDNVQLLAEGPTPGRSNGAAVEPDADGDGMPAAWELRHGLDPNNPADAKADADGDGLTNLQEYLAGTDPLDPGSLLRIEFLERDPAAGVVRLRFAAAQGRSYSVLAKTDLSQPGWRRVADIPPQASGGPLVVEDAAAASGEQGYYLLVTPALP